MTEHKKKTREKKHYKEDIKEVKKELEKQKNIAQERLTRLQYLQADFDNYRKQQEKEKQNIIQHANEKIIKELLTTVDDLERAIPKLGHEKEGMMLVQKNFIKILKSYGLHKIETIEKKFNPHIHEVIAKEQSKKEEGTILEEIQKGYQLHNKVLRPSRVKVAVQEVKENG